ncbi:MAG TPA: argininosuccinate lyase [Candidatus Polarisedimenticolaceae bacterium]
MKTLWVQGKGLDPKVAAYTASDDRAWDARLLRWDIVGSLAHADGLRAIGILGPGEHARLRAALRAALRDAEAGRLKVTARDEDVHTAVERRLTERLGPLGAKIHTGRSRNDQVLVDLRLYAKDALMAVETAALDAADALAAFARRHARVVFPGYTHQRRAMPQTTGLWAAGHAEGILDDLRALDAALDLYDRSPLGSAAGYGVPLELPREKVARALGFAGVQRHVTSVQSSRGKHDALALAALWALGSTLGKLSWDVILFTSEEFGYLILDPTLATGSSIMPQKKNPDLFELTRAREGLLAGTLAQAIAIAGKLPSGYHRDLQMLKAPLMTGLDHAEAMAAIVAFAVARLGVHRERCAAALDAGTYATHAAYARVRDGEPFRMAYRAVAEAIARGEDLPRRGSTAPLDLKGLRADLASARRRLDARRRRFDRAIARLTGGR